MSTPSPPKNGKSLGERKMPRVFSMQRKVTENVKNGLKWDGAIQGEKNNESELLYPDSKSST